MWIFSYLQLCVFGVFAVISGDFDLTIGFSSFEDNGNLPDNDQYKRLTDLDNWIRRSPGEIRTAYATLRSLKAASATFAVSRIILIMQYLIVLYYAREHNRDKRPLYWHLGGLIVSASLWFGAFAASFFNTRGTAITRIVLWSAGIVVEFACMATASAVQPDYHLDLEYWAERFSALTLIVLGEGSR